MSWFRYVWILFIGLLWLMWTLAAIWEAVDELRNKEKGFIEVCLNAESIFSIWLISHITIIISLSFICWVIHK